MTPAPVYLRRATTAGELRDQLRGIPENTPIHVIAGGFTKDRLGVGYGSDPNNVHRYVVVLDFNASEGLLT